MLQGLYKEYTTPVVNKLQKKTFKGGEFKFN